MSRKLFSQIFAYKSATIILGIVTLLFCEATFADVQTSELSKYEAFSQLSPDEMKNQLAKAFLHRIDFTRNLFILVEISGEQKAYNDATKLIGQLITPYSQKTYRLWLYKDQYRTDYPIRKNRDNQLFQNVVATYNAREGLHKGTVTTPETKDRIFARIDTRQDTTAFRNLFWIWLNDGFCDPTTEEHLPRRDYVFPDLLKNKSSWTIILLPDEKKIKIEYPFSSGFEVKESKGTKVLTLDPEKDFLPVSIRSRFDETQSNGQKFWVEKNLQVENSKIIDGEWMPTAFTEESAASWVEGKINVFRVKIEEIKHGKVSDSDVALKFSEGTEVVDAINGIAYKTDASGNPIQSTIEPLYGLDPSQMKMPQPKNKTRPILIVVGLFMIIAALYMQFQKRKKAA